MTRTGGLTRRHRSRRPRAAGPLAALTGVAVLVGATGVQAAASRCVDNSVPIYFAPQSVDLTQASTRVLQAGLRRSTPCRVDGVTLVGRGDSRGPGQANAELAGRRAETVADWLRSQGVAGDRIRVVAKPAEVPPRRILERRVTVHFHLSSRER